MVFRGFNKAAVRDAMLAEGFEVLKLKYGPRRRAILVDVVPTGQRPDSRKTEVVMASDMVRWGHRFED